MSYVNPTKMPDDWHPRSTPRPPAWAEGYTFPDQPVYPTKVAVFDDKELLMGTHCQHRRATSPPPWAIVGALLAVAVILFVTFGKGVAW